MQVTTKKKLLPLVSLFRWKMCDKEGVMINTAFVHIYQSCLTLSDPMDCSLPGSSIHGIFQAGVLEWVAIAFSE